MSWKAINGDNENGSGNGGATTMDPDSYWYMPPAVNKAPPGAQHGKSGVYYGGSWLDIEDCDGAFTISEDKCSGCKSTTPCPRSRSRPNNASSDNNVYDILIIGAGCIGASIARELSRYQFKTLLVEAADDVSQGATKGNSGIVHAGYDDKPGTLHAKYCWPGNQMFAQLDRELRFGYQINGSLVVAFCEADLQHLEELKERGEKNGVQNLRIVDQTELRKMEPHINEEAIAALYSPDAGNVIPYEFAIALAENAVDNGVELRIRREVQNITYGTPTVNGSVENGHVASSTEDEGSSSLFTVQIRHWEPEAFVNSLTQSSLMPPVEWLTIGAVAMAGVSLLVWVMTVSKEEDGAPMNLLAAGVSVLCALFTIVATWHQLTTTTKTTSNSSSTTNSNIVQMVDDAGPPVGLGKDGKVEVNDMLVGGSGCSRVQRGVTVKTETVQARYIVNCAGGFSDQIARMIGDKSFKIKPRLGDYLLLHRNQGRLAKHTLFPCPDPILGKGVLVQTTLWGNLILGPTARDIHKPEALNMSAAEVQEYILSKCKRLVPSFDPKETIHAFCGARAKSDRGDWIIEPSPVNPQMIHVAGIDSPGLAGSPAIALEVVRLLKAASSSNSDTVKDRQQLLLWKPNPTFNPHRAPIITPKNGLKGLKMGPVGKNDSDGSDEAKMAANIICKCERVTELEVVRAMRRSLPIDSSQAIRKRTRAGMGHCQADEENYNCEGRVRAIIARELGVPLDQVGGRPWPATSTLTQRWIDDSERQDLQKRMEAS